MYPQYGIVIFGLAQVLVLLLLLLLFCYSFFVVVVGVVFRWLFVCLFLLLLTRQR